MTATAPDPFLPAEEELDEVRAERTKQREAESAGSVDGVIPPFATNAPVVLLGPGITDVPLSRDGTTHVKWGERIVLFFVDADGMFQRSFATLGNTGRWLGRKGMAIDRLAVRGIRTAPRTTALLLLFAGGWIAAIWLRPEPVIIVPAKFEKPGVLQRVLDYLPKTREAR